MENFAFDLSLILVGTAVLSYLAVICKQPIIMAYILCGILFGPWGVGWVKDVEFIESISHLGITLLLFLAGLCLHPRKLIGLFKKTALITICMSLISFLIAFGFAYLFKFSIIECLCIGMALMFSSTILVVKLLPTTELHHERMGAICIGILILQDLLAIAVLAFIRCLGNPEGAMISFMILSLKLVVLLGALILFEQFLMQRIMKRIERLHELLFIIGLAWCFGVASISNYFGLFYETGAFFAGVVMARHPISRFISENLKPLRDFFLLLFFFILGAKINLFIIQDIALPACILATIFILIKPFVFKKFFLLIGETPKFANETGFRLGQLSEFSLLVAFLAFDLGQITERASQFIQLTTILTFIISSYIVVFRFQTPIGVSEKFIRN